MKKNGNKTRNEGQTENEKKNDENDFFLILEVQICKYLNKKTKNKKNKI